MSRRHLIVVTILLVLVAVAIVLVAQQYISSLSSPVNAKMLLFVAAAAIALTLLSQLNDVFELVGKLFGRTDGARKKSRSIDFCKTPIIHGFGEVWRQNPRIRQSLRCPPSLQDIEQATEITYQKFEHGEMLLARSLGAQTENVTFVLFGDNMRFGRVDTTLHDMDIQALEAYYAPPIPVGRPFAGIYWRLTALHTKQRLGRPTEPCESSDGAYQRFEGGLMLWIRATNDVYVLTEQDGHRNEVNRWDAFRNVIWSDYPD